MENLPQLAEQEFNQITKFHKGIIPETIEIVTEKLNGLSSLLVASDWYRAAIVRAYTEKGINQYKMPDEDSSGKIFTFNDFVNLKIKGLSTRDAVRHYYLAWESTGLPKPKPGEEIILPNEPFPEWGTMKNVHVSQNTGENEWYTPLKYIESAKKVMRNIDLDPASSKIANNIVKAKYYFSKENNGLLQKWWGNIWLNPPYSQPLINQFSDKFVNEIENIGQACILTNNATETKWYQNFMKYSNVICFITGRINFIDIDGNNSGKPLQGQTIIYYGNNKDGFYKEFKKYGTCLMRIEEK